MIEYIAAVEKQFPWIFHDFHVEHSMVQWCQVLHPQYSDEGSESIIQGPAGDVPQVRKLRDLGSRFSLVVLNATKEFPRFPRCFSD